MKLTEICIKRPVFSTVLSLIIILLGIVAFNQLQIRQYPRIEEPQISITTELEGASPQLIETTITKVLEDALSGLEGLYSMSSRSDQGASYINLTFNLNRDVEAAANDVRDKIGRVRNKLPEHVSEPRIKKANADATPFIYLALSSDRLNIEELADYAFRNLESQLEVISGVANVDIWGGGEYDIEITLDPIKLANFRLTTDDVAAAIKRQNIEKPAGSIITETTDITITTKAPLVTPQDYSNVVVANRDGALVRLSDIGKADLSTQMTKNRVRFNGKPAISIGIIKQATANPLSIATDLKNLLPRLRGSLPQGMQLDIASDQTIFIEKSIREVGKTLIEATILVIVVILLFLRSFRAILIPFVTIPVSLIGTLFLMYCLNFSINILTLFALVLAIGLVVDDAIVMLENIYRHIENGMKPMRAAFLGAQEISFAVVAMTVTLAAVYAPIALSTGLIGRLFTEFALTLAGAVILSGFVALTLTPMMCGRLLKAHDKKLAKKKLVPTHAAHPFKEFFARFDAKAEVFLDKVDNFYAKLLKYSLNTIVPIPVPSFIVKAPRKIKVHGSILVLTSGFLIAVLGYFIAISLRSEFLPTEDQGILKVRVISPFGANIDFVDKYMKKTEEIVAAIPEIQSQLTIASVPGESTSINILKPWEQRNRSTQKIAEETTFKLQQIPAIDAYARSYASTISSAGRAEDPVNLVIKTSLPYEELLRKGSSALRVLKTMPELEQQQILFSADGQEYIVSVDRDKAAELGIDVDVIASTLETAVGGKPITKFKRENKLYPVKIQLAERGKTTLEDIGNVFVRGTRDKKEPVLVPLSEVIRIKKASTPIEITHSEGFRSLQIYASLAKGYSLGDTLFKTKDAITQAVGDSKTFVDFAGESRRYLEESKNIYIIFGLALTFIFLVLAAQYESWRDPFIILLSVPMSLTGGVLLLLIFGQSLNLYSLIGLVTLIGLITKHGILIVDFANKLKADGLSRVDAVIEASRLRLRPILMTTFAMILGAAPLAFASGAGMETRRPIGLVIVGGMLVGTIFTLFVVPAVYTYLSRKTANPDVEGLEANNHRS